MSEAVVHQVTADETGQEVVDMVCDMDVEVVEATPAASYKGETYYFCSEYCRDEFIKDPQKYMDSHEHSHDTTGHH
ncbi:MAG: YHS domain-containing protein [candidate division Zixibacteria bacterium]|nr:YHS domain-containing protein [candidate division Zixibacteria bacterium]